MIADVPFRLRSDGVQLAVRLTPRASRSSIDGIKKGVEGAFIQARVRAVPEDGKANAALVELVATELGLPKSTVTVAAGHTARLKLLHIQGDSAALAERVNTWLKRLA